MRPETSQSIATFSAEKTIGFGIGQFINRQTFVGLRHDLTVKWWDCREVTEDWYWLSAYQPWSTWLRFATNPTYNLQISAMRDESRGVSRNHQRSKISSQGLGSGHGAWWTPSSIRITENQPQPVGAPGRGMKSHVVRGLDRACCREGVDWLVEARY